MQAVTPQTPCALQQVALPAGVTGSFTHVSLEDQRREGVTRLPSTTSASPSAACGCRRMKITRSPSIARMQIELSTHVSYVTFCYITGAWIFWLTYVSILARGSRRLLVSASAHGEETMGKVKKNPKFAIYKKTFCRD